MLLTTNELREIEATLAERLKVDYSKYSDDFFRRRLAYVFEKMHFHRVQDLYAALGSLVSSDEISYYLAVPQTELFRAPSFWRRLIKSLADGCGKKAWLPCLTSYHELFSLAVALDLAGCDDVDVVANVLSDRTIAECRSLRVSKHDDDHNRSNFERLESAAAYDDYVVKSADGLSLRDGMLGRVTFRNGWFLNTPDEKYDVVICRDVTLAYSEKLTRQAVAKLVDSLAGPEAVLGIGVMERPLGSEERLDCSLSADGFYKLIK